MGDIPSRKGQIVLLRGIETLAEAISSREIYDAKIDSSSTGEGHARKIQQLSTARWVSLSRSIFFGNKLGTAREERGDSVLDDDRGSDSLSQLGEADEDISLSTIPD